MQQFKKIFSEGKSVLILGFGKEGHSTFSFLSKHFPECKVGIADQNTRIADEEINVPLHLGKDYLQAINDYDLIIKSPGIMLRDIPESTKEKITSQADLFLREFGRQTIGITGTKGKSTTVSLIYHLLKRTGRSALLMGNIGLPAFDFLEKIRKNDLIVYELSAHQLEFVHSSPHIAVLLNLFPEHLDYFGTFERYKKAKLNIFRFQRTKDYVFCGEEFSGIMPSCETPADMEQKLKTVSGGKFYPGELLKHAGLKGNHNLKNILLAFKVVNRLGIPLSVLPVALSHFKTLPHRLEYVGHFGGIDFYNDSISTVPQSTMAAVKSVGPVDVLILGGFDRGLDYSGLVDFLIGTDIKNFFFLGKAGERMLRLFNARDNNKNLYPVDDLATIFRQLQSLLQVSCCLLSPAAASYDQFHNFEHRGDLFKKLAGEFLMDK
ncbi:MAG TPA: UDP-N-acetylmuramoyl-L-alanine--D-glutamate ligase [Bacteroidetes bacterium]|nr:UDP-N-acetylmuramoyl-L-alanine--D-glutamate ligase [Bacteroidota bacterium]